MVSAQRRLTVEERMADNRKRAVLPAEMTFALTCVEFGFRKCEQGMNLQMALDEARKVLGPQGKVKTEV